VIAFFKPQTMLWFDKPWIFWSLAASMLGMGLTLSIDDFKAIGRMPGSVALGFVAQYTIMPLSGWLVATALKLDPGLAVGIILVASCPGGMASNMISYLAKANVALSVVLTMCSTLLAFFFTPMWTSHARREVCAGGCVGALRVCAFQLTIAPVVLGVLIRWKLPRTADKSERAGPPSPCWPSRS
jgi:BASS family bile acid:Na+ symporter